MSCSPELPSGCLQIVNALEGSLQMHRSAFEGLADGLLNGRMSIWNAVRCCRVEDSFTQVRSAIESWVKSSGSNRTRGDQGAGLRGEKGLLSVSRWPRYIASTANG
jgi:hypothetical protein